MSVEQILPAETLIQQYPPELHIYNGGNNLVLLTGNANIPLAEAVAARIGCTLDEPVSYFSNGESHVAIKENLRKRHVVIVQSGYPNPPLQKTDTEFMVDAARRGSADKIDVVYTHYPWQREDQKHRSRTSISASVVSSILQHLGASRIMTVDLHAGQTTGSILLPWDDLPSSYAYMPRILEWGLNDMVFASPDAGRAKLNEILAAKVGVPMATILKNRDTSKMNESEAKGILGDVQNKNVILIDDMFDTCGSIINAAKIIMDEGATSVYAAAGHGVFSGKAFERLRSGPFKKILVTNTIQQEIPADLQDLIEVVDISGMLSKAIWYNMIGKSLSEEFY